MIDAREITKKSGPIRILAVDDNPAALYATSRVLRSAGYEVIEATTGAGALSAAAGADLIVLDVNLPDVDGFEVCRRLREDPKTAQIRCCTCGDVHQRHGLHARFRGGRGRLSDAAGRAAGAARDRAHAAFRASRGSPAARRRCPAAHHVQSSRPSPSRSWTTSSSSKASIPPIARSPGDRPRS